jgi:transcriptional adapter 2-alpha
MLWYVTAKLCTAIFSYVCFAALLFAVASKSKHCACAGCRKDISTQAKIRCAVCDEMFLCLGCFSTGTEPRNSPHKYWHDYRIIEFLHVPLFCADWGADEEILLLEGLEVRLA